MFVGESENVLSVIV